MAAARALKVALAAAVTAAAWVLGAAPACYSPAYRNGGLVCAEGSCPEGYYCAATTNRCWRNGTVPPLPDAPPDEPPRPPDGGAPVETAPPPSPDAEPDNGSNDPDVEPEVDVPPPDPLARLSSLMVEPGVLEPAFTPTNTRYDLNVPLFTPVVSVTAVAEHPTSDLSFNFTASKKGMVSGVQPLAPGPTTISIEVGAPMTRTSAYRISVNAGGDFTYVKPPNTHAKMAFGSAMALAGGLLVVGAPADKSTALGPQTGETPPSGVETGAAFVYARTGGSWRREVTLKPSHLHPAMKFGAAVAVAGDLVVVGAPGESGGGKGVNPPADAKAQESGAAFVFAKGPDGWIQQAYLKASDTATGDLFGASVAISQSSSGGMTTTTIAVGAPGSGGTINSPHTGAVYVFVRTGNSGPLTQQAMPRPMTPKGNNEFGASVALSGETLVVGSPREDSGASGVNPGQTSSTAANSGAVFIFTRNGTSWPQPVYVKAPVALNEAAFGARVAIAGQLMAVAAPSDPGSWRGIDQGPTGPPSPQGTGAVFLYHRNGNTWSLLHQIKAAKPHFLDSFGQGLALSANTLVVGAPLEDASQNDVGDPAAGPTDSGALYVFRPGADNRWSQLVRLKAPNAEAGDQFGYATATDGDTVVGAANAEGSSAINIDGRLSDNGALGSGAVYLY